MFSSKDESFDNVKKNKGFERADFERVIDEAILITIPEFSQVEKLLKLEDKKIPKDIDYDKVMNIASEARQKLKLVRPETIAQATRISGVNPSDIAILMVYLRRNPHD